MFIDKLRLLTRRRRVSCSAPIYTWPLSHLSQVVSYGHKTVFCCKSMSMSMTKQTQEEPQPQQIQCTKRKRENEKVEMEQEKKPVTQWKLLGAEAKAETETKLKSEDPYMILERSILPSQGFCAHFIADAEEYIEEFCARFAETYNIRKFVQYTAETFEVDEEDVSDVVTKCMQEIDDEVANMYGSAVLL